MPTSAWLAEILAVPHRTQIVDIGANPIDGDPPYARMLHAGRCDVTGFEPHPQALARLVERAGPHERYLPYAVGDGERHRLRMCAESGFSSLLPPDAAQMAVLTDFPRLSAVVDEADVATTRLDDIAEIERADLVKIDIQGGELDVFRGGRRTLRDAVAVQTEVGFHRLYEGAPTFADVDLELRDQGFVPHAFVSRKTWPLAPVEWADPWQERARHLVETDVVYVRDLSRLDALTDEALGHLALVAHEVYDSVGVVLLALRALRDRGAIAADAPEQYRRRLAP